MKKIASKWTYLWAVVIAGLLAVAPTIADQLSGAAGGKRGVSEYQQQPQNNQPEQADDALKLRHWSDRPTTTTGRIFGDRHRAILSDYYGDAFRAGRCPAGLDKKQNSCKPPAHSKTWAVGRPLPQDVTEYDLPRTLAVQFGQPPAGHRYARVAGDILLIALDTGTVIDVMQDMGPM